MRCTHTHAVSHTHIVRLLAKPSLGIALLRVKRRNTQAYAPALPGIACDLRTLACCFNISAWVTCVRACPVRGSFKRRDRTWSASSSRLANIPGSEQRITGGNACIHLATLRLRSRPIRGSFPRKRGKLSAIIAHDIKLYDEQQCFQAHCARQPAWQTITREVSG